MKKKMSFGLRMFRLVMLLLLWKVVLWDLLPRTETTKEMVIVLVGLSILTLPVLLHAWSNALQHRIEHHLHRMFHYKNVRNAEQFAAHRSDVVPLMQWQKITTILTVVVILGMITYRYFVLL